MGTMKSMLMYHVVTINLLGVNKVHIVKYEFMYVLQYQVHLLKQIKTGVKNRLRAQITLQNYCQSDFLFIPNMIYCFHSNWHLKMGEGRLVKHHRIYSL